MKCGMEVGRKKRDREEEGWWVWQVGANDSVDRKNGIQIS
jgi:hypothetical protein